MLRRLLTVLALAVLVVPAAPATASQARLVPLRAEVPSWYTPELHRAVVSSGGTPLAAPLDAPLPSEVGIRPGSWMVSPSGCTMNFIFRNGSSYAIGTAGHCVDQVNQPVVLLTLAPGGSNPVLVNIGNVLKMADDGLGEDFALVSIQSSLVPWVSATTSVVGGPCGTFAGSGTQVVTHYGHGLGIGTGGTPRAGVAMRWENRWFGWYSPAIFGDSGSPVLLADGRAAGNLTHLYIDGSFRSTTAGTRIARMIQIAGSGWSLAQSPLCSL